MRTSREGLVEIAAHEGIVTSPYKDSVGVWTVGIGHTANAGAPDPAKHMGEEFSIARIMDMFARDVAKFEARVGKAFTRKLTQVQFDAAVSFDFNTGAIHKASWVKHFNAGDMAKARKGFMDWRKPPEIVPRRTKERDLFFDGKYSSSGKAMVYPATRSGQVLWSQGVPKNVSSLMDMPTEPPATARTAPKAAQATPIPAKSENAPQPVPVTRETPIQRPWWIRLIRGGQ